MNYISIRYMSSHSCLPLSSRVPGYRLKPAPRSIREMLVSKQCVYYYQPESQPEVYAKRIDPVVRIIPTPEPPTPYGLRTAS
jgi:hypothetical protein